MTTYYADFDLSTGNNDGTTAANAWRTLADVIAGSNGTAPAAGDTVLCKGTDSISATVTINIAGSTAGGFIKLTGVDASWNNVGGSTRAVIDGGGNSLSCLTFNGANYFWLENFEIKNAGSSGISSHGVTWVTAYSDHQVLLNVISHSNYGTGFNINNYSRFSHFVQCRAHSNAGYGFHSPRYTTLLFCRADNNSSRGFNGYNTTFYGCIAHDNSSDGIYSYSGSGLFNSVAYNNSGDGITVSYAGSTMSPMGCRSVGNGTGVNTTDRVGMLFYYGASNTTPTAGYPVDIPIAGVSTMVTAGSDTDGGFSDPSSDDFTLDPSATFFDDTVEIP